MMGKVQDLEKMVKGLSFQKGEYTAAEAQLIKFADLYMKCTPIEAEELRENFDPKLRQGLLKTAISLFKVVFEGAKEEQKIRLCKIIFAAYSFDNLNMSYDSFLYIDIIEPKIRKFNNLVSEYWYPFQKLTSNSIAQDKMDSIMR